MKLKSSYPKIKKAFKDAVEKGIEYDMELQIVTQNGKTIWVRCKGIPEFVNGECVSVFGIFQDINERKRYTLELAQDKKPFSKRLLITYLLLLQCLINEMNYLTLK